MKSTVGIAAIAFMILALSGPALGQSGWTDDGSVVRLTDSTDKVGIGTTSPVKDLHLQRSTNGLVGVDFKNTSTGASAYQATRFISGTNIAGVYAYGQNHFSMANLALFTAHGSNTEMRLRQYNNAPLTIHTNNQERMRITAGGSVGIGTASPKNNLDVEGAAVIGAAYSGTNTAPSNGLLVQGNVGIGTTNPGSYKLAVNGNIRAKDVIVETGWSDFVFDYDYHLKPLQEVETFIQTHKHLPGIPSAEEVSENGVALGDMQAKLLQKIEELTLYMIDLKKENEALKARMAMLER